MLEVQGFGSLPMNRTPEPELMEGLEQAQAYAAANFAAGDQALIERLAVLFPQGLGERLVDLGCGPGNISFRLAERYSGAAVLGIDGAAAMLAPALQRLAEQPLLKGRLRFEQRCLPAADLPGGYTAVVSNSLLHHLHDPQVLWRSVAQLAGPGACVYIKDLRRPASAQAALELMRPARRGTIIGIASVMAVTGYRNQGAYAASKHAVLGLLRVLAKEVQPDGVRVSCLCPGAVDTAMVRASRPDLGPEDAMGVDDVAAAVRYLLSLSPRCAVDVLHLRRAAAEPFAV
jgi:SAM-dependent methyltransferase